MSDNNSPETKYDVFVSFRGKDIRDGFLSHLTDTFLRKKINVFVDETNLKKGDEIWPSLAVAIEVSSISLIIFSQDYASSRWCLEELVKILECREKYGRIVIPIFYHVQPKNVRHQLGSYENIFAQRGRKYKTKVQIWKDALNISADLSGVESSRFQNDAELIQEIVNVVLNKLAKPSVNSKGIVGIDEEIANVELLISKEPKKTRLIGIWGMGGIGKSTLAEKVLNKLRSGFEGCYFLANEREQSNRHGLISLKEKIFSELLGYDVKIDTLYSLPEDIVRRISCMKVLLILDDVNDLDHLEKLLGTLDNFGSGSRIIVTTRDEQVLKANKVDEIYRLREFNHDKALEFFNLNTFNQSDDQREYSTLSEKVVDYARGIPLVLKVLAHLLRGRKKEIWESELDKLRRMPPTTVYDAMKLSYDDLDRKEQQLFLDLACFFLRSHIIVNVSNVKSLLKDGESDNSVVVGLERLKDKALITISEDNCISMHDCLQEMAWEIVRREDPESRSWLWDPNDDIYEALENDKCTEAIRSIRIHLPTFKKHKLCRHIFAKMRRLQFLETSGEYRYNFDCFDQHDILAEGLQFLATELKFLCWYYYPLKLLPENFSPEKLVILNMPGGRIEKLWHGVKNLVNLKQLDLGWSQMLKELPDLSKARNLEVLLLGGCSMLSSVHPSIFSLPKLEKLDLWNCRSLTRLASDCHLCSLCYLNLDYCKNLTEFSLISENMKELGLRFTKVKALPSTFGCQSKLKSLHLKGSAIERLPASINNLTQLLHLEVSRCRKLQTIAELPMFLETLDVYFCTSLRTLQELPPFLKTLNVKDCKSLQTLAELPLSLKTLNVKECKSLQTLPKLPPLLETLYVRKCTSLQTLPELPCFVKTLYAIYCTSLKTVLFPSTAVEQLKENRTRVLFLNCLKLDEHSLEAIGLTAQINVMKFANQHLSTPNHDHVENYNDYDYGDNHHSYQAVYLYPGSSVPEWMEYKTTKDYINIDLSSAPYSPLLSFIFCFVLDKYRDTALIERFYVNITVNDGEGERKKDSVRMHIGYLDSTIESNHVCVMYDQRCSHFLNSRAKNQTRLRIEVSMGVRIFYYETYKPLQRVLKGFGVSLISS
ncbi:hypothetical protein JHK82_042489 [Glycine max]|uniref:ADP-ribosyl cyclase/cyclic ADP-ribose hydrolase n=2 Tax=Glycine subgen. Soja TaxID=1462606 RepID=K7MBP2_SOYBN|nr:disease resistance protein LAZ5 [Glycine max]XP_028204465.1 disease resistance-like protein DSC1 [Glycine soja]KAG4946417.1 hypothetical protein JHK87_042424 [Glycine soja]KAG4956771.1 hypothetical protein JHK85_043151 [Glycine max]KAG5105519.1 hypothetical protein JHK82_042489 [Glycine max]KAG5116629.1 hypothetical protein JHK84_042742 [Glycine max]KAH1147416.1 hypothetical protein GYH30_042534 [Glycine max]|eukprot:XP_003547433.1 disease resistance-like protein DSC1 [Glycine max]